MRAVLKWLRRAVILVLVLAAGGAGGGYLWLRGSLPEIDGERSAFGLAEAVEVVRDRNGVPHILARNEEDALFALGYVHAQDRLWQMEMNRRIGAGRLAEVLGPAALGTDRLLRTLGLHHRAEATLPNLDPGARRRIDAYVNGVNAWLETREGPLPPEFLIVGFEPEPWTAADTAVWPKVMALDLGREWTRDLMRLRMSDFLAPDQVLDFYTPYRDDMPRGVLLPGSSSSSSSPSPAAPPERPTPAAGGGPLPNPDAASSPAGGSPLPAGQPNGAQSGSGPATGTPPDRTEHASRLALDAARGPDTRGRLPAGRLLPPTSPDRDATAEARETPRLHASLAPGAAGFLLRSRSGHPGSNSWVVSGTRSVTEKPLLANDPHLGLTVPSVWYFAHLSWPGRDVVGATFPGMPIVVLGHNGRAAWGLTNTGADTQDLFIEKLDPENPARYLAPGGYRRFEVRREVIKVKDGDDMTLRIRETRHGPVLGDASAAAAGAAPPGHVIALGWTALRDDDRTLEAGLGLPEATDWTSFVANMRNFHSPPQNVSYADVEGNIGFLVPGRIPMRKWGQSEISGARPLAGNLTLTPFSPADPGRLGTTPRPGWDKHHDWSGFIPFDALPREYNPPGGAIVTANHDVTAKDYPHRLTVEWAAGFRARRIMELLAARPRHDAESFRSLQQDRVSAFARALLPRLRGVPLGAETTPLARRAHGLLDAWEGDMDPERPEPLVFNAWVWEFGRLVTADELGPVQREAWGRKGAFLLRILETREGWCDDVVTAERTETCDEMLARALERAVGRLAERHGDDPDAWRWGEEHFALAEHRPLAESPLSRLFNLRGPAPGSIYTINSFEFSPLARKRPFTTTHGPSLRAIYDLADLDRSLFIHSTGQSGNVLSPLYDSFEERWRTGEYITIPTRRTAFEDGALGHLRLVPR